MADINTTELASFRPPMLQRLVAVRHELERQTAVPLLIGHLKQINLWHRAGNIDQSVNAAEG